MLALLKNYASMHGMESPLGRGSRDEKPLRLLPSDTTKLSVYETYETHWPTIIEAVQTHLNARRIVEDPPKYNVFVRYWTKFMPTLRIGKTGSDYCDTCTTLLNALKVYNTDDSRYQSCDLFLKTNRNKAKIEFTFYKECQQKAYSRPNAGMLHLVFDFAEKVLLPRLQHQPGQLQFITGLKFDLFGISCSNVKKNYLFGLPEGHWPNEKTANVVVSMSHWLLRQTKEDFCFFTASYKLVLHADNCSGQNNNRFVIWYLTWRVIIRLSDRIELYFLVAGRTKNAFDGAFGHVKESRGQTMQSLLPI